jgi:hypothetical protein
MEKGRKRRQNNFLRRLSPPFFPRKGLRARQSNIYHAVRVLLQRMNISLLEPKHTRTGSTCCGDSFWGVIPTAQVKEQMIKRTAEMPAQEVVVYCISCSKAVFIGGKTPRCMIDLLFGEETVPQTLEPDRWHQELDDYIRDH